MESTDPRWGELAELLVRYSAGVKPRERVMIAMGEVESFPLAQAVYEAVIKAGGFPQVQFLSETLRHSLLQHGNEEQLNWVPEIEAHGMEWADVHIGLRGAFDLQIHEDIPAERLASNQKAMGKISSLRWEKTRWCLVRVPNARLTVQCGTDLETITSMFFQACLVDWRAASARWQGWAEKLNRTSNIRLLGEHTDLTFSVAGRKWVVADGHINMPDGEIYTSPVAETLDGEIFFEFPGVLSGWLIEGIRLRWNQGTLVEASASTNESYLKAILQTDPGASVVGEFGIGTNPAVTRFCKDILLDEKIGGTVHLALGRAYPECGGTNRSAIHWDIIKDIRKHGAVYADGEAVLKDGEFLM